MKLEKTVLGFPIRAEITKLDDGWEVGIFGGCKTHVGAVTLASPDGAVQTMERPGHRDGVLSHRWGMELAAHLSAPVCVRCGIHYDYATKEQLAVIMAACEDLLREAKENL
ncbi:MAG: hypothetical protein ACI3VX_05190 [Faecousia sp.]